LAKIKRGNQNIAESLSDHEWSDHKDSLLRTLNKNKDDWLRITALIDEAREQIEQMEEALSNEEALKDFLMNNREQFAKLREELFDLAPADKQTLIEGMIDQKIRITKALKGDEPSWERMPYRIRFNQSILKRFFDEGKITSLD
jgi:hypothetical protein